MRRATDVLPPAVRERVRLARAAVLERRSRRAPGVRGIALVMHGVSAAPEARPAVVPAFPAPALDALAGHLRGRYALVRARELLPAAQARRPGDPIPLALTFDDDLRSHLELAAPVLERHGATATAFLTGASTPFWWQALQAAVDAGTLRPEMLPDADPALVQRALAGEPRALRQLARAIEPLPEAAKQRLNGVLSAGAPAPPPALDAAGRQALADRGWELGFHTRTHPLMPALDDAALEAAVGGADEALPGVAPSAFAYPHGKAGPREAAAVRRAGFAVAFTGTPGAVDEHTDPALVPRLDLQPGTRGAMALAIARALTTPGQRSP